MKPTTALVLERSKFALILSNFPKEREIILKMAEWRVQAQTLFDRLQCVLLWCAAGDGGWKRLIDCSPIRLYAVDVLSTIELQITYHAVCARLI